MANPKSSSASPKRKRPASWGTIRRRESGKFEAFYRMEGRTMRAPRRFDSEAEAQAWLATERAAHVTGTWIDPERVSVAPAGAAGVLTPASTFEALCEALIAEEAVFAEARPAYLHEQARLIRRVIIPTLGAVPLGAVKPSLLDAAYQQWHAHSASQARNALVALRKVVKLGKRRDVFTFDMADSIRVHPRPDREIVTLAPMQLAQFRRTIEEWRERPDRHGPQPSRLLIDVTDVMLATSARIGEALGLRVQDVDLGHARTVVTIAGTLIEGHGQRKHWQPATKTEAGMRSIIVPEWVVPTLERLTRAANLHGTDFLFHTSSGLPTGSHSVHRQLRAVREWAGLSSELVPHVFRKTVATTIADHESGGLDAAALTLGHSRSRVTEQHYAKRRTLAPDMREALATLGEGSPRSNLN
ncbi:tyrosine-type recombinase/integrase [Microbacterium sp. SSW1-59]|uniref:tyrosine-type recombinase/integrase n=1 Tax=Microbacterium xanthum TaxID=3079794 RepID=UPI002AD481D1|nr:tyrosine-type recombinase/integrase [Microbacterium sp. SSW1-59]MDZ8201868.1 tyrosine-type recombinase/integrase [Microbacterium sp. SSW1-59]